MRKLDVVELGSPYVDHCARQYSIGLRRGLWWTDKLDSAPRQKIPATPISEIEHVQKLYNTDHTPYTLTDSVSFIGAVTVEYTSITHNLYLTTLAYLVGELSRTVL